MKEFTLAESDLPFNFFDEVDFGFQTIAIDLIKRKYAHLSGLECENVFEQKYDLFSDIMCELRDSEAIMDYATDWLEVDESTGTWGYIKFEVDDINQARVKLEREAKMLLKELMIDFSANF
jgi:hypothetical protein